LVNMVTDSSEGYVELAGYKLFYRAFGERVKGTVLGLHGGPGATHDYLLPLADLAQFGYRVVLYDQLGCGKSEVPKNPALFTVERAVEEVEGVRVALNLGRMNLIGSSWGGMLAIAYALRYQKNLKSIVTVGGLASVPFTTAEMQRMKSQLPNDVQEVMKKYEDLGDYENPEYLKAVEVFYRKHLCRLAEWPKELVHSLEHMSKPVYLTMNGPNEFTIIGNIRYWDVTHLLHKIHVPTLVTGGRYDEVSPREARSIHRGIKRSKLVTFQNSSHLPMWEEREKFITVVRKHLDKVN
jgi:proline iminopeptidase